MSLYPVILSGGLGKRLWPLSRPSKPKQFLSLNSHTTMLQETVLRLNDLKTHPPTIICNRKHSNIAAKNMYSINETIKPILLEPVSRNTAPAIAACALKIVEEDINAVLLILPSDHVIEDRAAFCNAVNTAAQLANRDYLVTFGVKPISPHTGYGYLKRGDNIEKGYKLTEYKEKPDKDTAKKYVSSEAYLWNSGIFCFRAKTILDELEKHYPKIIEYTKHALNNAAITDNNIFLNECDFVQCQSISIDYAVMEHTQRGVIVPLDAGWRDIGSWGALWNLHKERMLHKNTRA